MASSCRRKQPIVSLRVDHRPCGPPALDETSRRRPYRHGRARPGHLRKIDRVALHNPAQSAWEDGRFKPGHDGLFLVKSLSDEALSIER